jgi:hypothetical protein
MIHSQADVPLAEDGMAAPMHHLHDTLLVGRQVHRHRIWVIGSSTAVGDVVRKPSPWRGAG